MRATIEYLKRTPNYVQAFGVSQGIAAQWRARKPSADLPSNIRDLTVPGYDNPIFLRDTVSDSAAFWQCIVRGQYGFRQFKQAAKVYEKFEAMQKRGEAPVIIDCGANIGLASVWFAQAFPDAQIVAIEPDADNYAMTQKNVAAFGARTQVLQGGIWNEDGYLNIKNPDAGSMSFEVVYSPEGGPDALVCYTISGVLKRLGVGAANIVKIDIEGAQDALFRSNIDWVKDVDVIMIELEDWEFAWSASSMTFLRAIAPYDFDIVIHGENLFCFKHDS